MVFARIGYWPALVQTPHDIDMAVEAAARSYLVGLEEVVERSRVAVAPVFDVAAVLAHLVRVEEASGRTLRG
jgi:hypothetical protein